MNYFPKKFLIGFVFVTIFMLSACSSSTSTSTPNTSSTSSTSSPSPSPANLSLNLKATNFQEAFSNKIEEDGWRKYTILDEDISNEDNGFSVRFSDYTTLFSVVDKDSNEIIKFSLITNIDKPHLVLEHISILQALIGLIEPQLSLEEREAINDELNVVRVKGGTGEVIRDPFIYTSSANLSSNQFISTLSIASGNAPASPSN